MSCIVLLLWFIGSVIGMAIPAYYGITTWNDFETAADWFGVMWIVFGWSMVAWAVIHWILAVAMPWPEARHRKLASFRAALSMTVSLISASALNMIDFSSLHWVVGEAVFTTAAGWWQALWYPALMAGLVFSVVYLVNTTQVYYWVASGKMIDEV